MKNFKRIYVHAGMFHADDVFCVAALAQISGTQFTVLRVRELPIDFDINNGDIATDVGGRFVPEQGVFDHHQKGGNEDGMAAIGKLWSVFGSEICGDQRTADRVYLTLLAAIDRADIGVSDWNPVREDWRHLSASALISSMNPEFGCSDADRMEAFLTAVEAARFALKGTIQNARSFIKMSDVVASATRHFDGRVIELNSGGPWQEHIFEQKLENVLYVIYPSERGGFCLQAVPDAPGSFGMRKPLPDFWAGLRGQELASLIGLPNYGPATFCHPGRFIGGAETLDDVLGMVGLALLC